MPPTRALRFEGEALPPIMALEIARRGGIENARSIYCGTFSKVLSPGLRVGWIVAPQAMIRRLVLVKQASDLNNSTINQMVMHRLAETAFDAQVERARAALPAPPRRHAGGAAAPHARGCDLDASRRAACSSGCACPRASTRQPCSTAPSKEAGVAFVPGAAFFHDGRGRNTLRLSYSLATEAQIEDGIARLAQLI